VTRGAKKAYRQQALRWHPDKNDATKVWRVACMWHGNCLLKMTRRVTFDVSNDLT
jgi:hypothetical protein